MTGSTDNGSALSPALSAQEKLVEDTITAEREKVAAYLEMAYGCGDPKCRSCIGKMLADAILDGDHDSGRTA